MAENKVIIDGKDREKENDYILQVNHLTKLYGASNKAEAAKLMKEGKTKDEVFKETGVTVALWDVRYLKVSITVSYDSSYKDIEKITTLISYNIINCFMAKRADDFTADNLKNIKEEIKNTLNIQLGENVIKNIYFTNIVVQ